VRQHEHSSAAVGGNFLGENILVLESVVNCKMSAEGRAGWVGGVFEEINRKMPSVRKALVASLHAHTPSPSHSLTSPRWLRGNAQ